MDAVERLNRFKEEFKIRERKHELYSGTQHRHREYQEEHGARGMHPLVQTGGSMQAHHAT